MSDIEQPTAAKQNSQEKVRDLLKAIKKGQTENTLIKFSGESRGIVKIEEVQN